MVPKPPVNLKNQCSVIHNDTLYVYSPSAFQSIELSPGAQWKELQNGVPVTGGVCVEGAPNGDASQAALYVVGGVTNTSATNYPGLQRFTFASQQWESITPISTVTANRQYHGATFLNATSQILVYSGSQVGSTTPSSETFLISAFPPYQVDSMPSIAPPVVSPMVMPWNDSHAVMFGGDPNNKQLFTFDPTDGWQDTGVLLSEGIADQTTTKCTLVFGDDGSKVLETYYMGVTPNKVTRTVILDSGGQPASTGQTVGEPASKRRKRDLTISNWPSYNDTFAPEDTRSGFSISQDPKGFAVISGGNSQDPLCIFDERQNTWVNITTFFEKATDQIPFSASSTISSASSTGTATSSPTSITAPVASTDSSDHKSKMLTVLGATLGAIFGIAAILLIVLLLLRWRKEKRRQALEGYVEKDRLSFADRGAEFMSEAGGSIGKNYLSNSKANSQSSLAIITGRVTGHKRGIGPLGSDASTAGLVKKPSPLGYNDPVEMTTLGDIKSPTFLGEKLATQEEGLHPATATDPSRITTGLAPTRSRSSGWSRYFANNEATNLAHMQSGISTYTSDRSSGASHSEYTDSRIMSQPPHQVPPLDLNFAGFDGQRLSQVAKGSPTLTNSREDLHRTGIAVGQPMQAELARANSTGSSVSGVDHQDSTYGSGNAEESTWDPVSRNEWYQRPPSSAYTGTPRETMIREGASSYYPNDGTSSYYPKSQVSSVYPPSGLHIPGKFGDSNEGRESTVTVFPRAASPEIPQRKALGHQDMSWLNLGTGAR